MSLLSICRAVVAAAMFSVVAWVPTSALAQDPGEMVVRLTRLENQLREMAGQIEQLQYENRRLADQLRKFQEDVDFRLGEKSGRPSAQSGSPASGQGRGQISAQGGAQGSSPIQQGSVQQASPQAPVQQRGGRRSDAFDPAANPNAPGSPRQLGSMQSAAAGGSVPAGVPRGAIEVEREDEDVSAGPGGRVARGSDDVRPPLDVGPRERAVIERAPVGRGPVEQAPIDRGPSERTVDRAPPEGQQMAARAPSVSGGSGDPRQDYEGAYAQVLQRRYAEAEMAFRAFLQAHPRDRLAPDATYWLGESFYQRARYREAAEQFLKVTTDYGSSSKASDGMLKLGMALNGMGERDKACGTYGEVQRKYPNLREAVEREKKRAKC